MLRCNINILEAPRFKHQWKTVSSNPFTCDMATDVYFYVTKLRMCVCACTHTYTIHTHTHIHTSHPTQNTQYRNMDAVSWYLLYLLTVQTAEYLQELHRTNDKCCSSSVILAINLVCPFYLYINLRLEQVYCLEACLLSVGSIAVGVVFIIFIYKLPAEMVSLWSCKQTHLLTDCLFENNDCKQS